MEKNDLKRKLNRGFGQLSENIELKKIDPDRLGPLSEQELEDIFGIRKKKSYIPSYGYHALAAVASLVVLITGVFSYIDRSDNYTKLDISGRPAVTLYLRDSKVKRVRAENKDDSDIIRDLDKDQSLDDALNILLHRMDEKGYLKESDNKIDIVIKGSDKDNVERQVSSSLRRKLDEIHISVPVTINHQELNTAEKLYDMPAENNIQTTENTGPDNDSTGKENEPPAENTKSTERIILDQTGQEKTEDPAEATTENNSGPAKESSTADENKNDTESENSDINADTSEENDSENSVNDQQAASSETDSQVQTNTEDKSSTKSTRAPGKKNSADSTGSTENKEKKKTSEIE